MNIYNKQFVVFQVNEFKDHYREVTENLPKWVLVV